MARRLPPKDVVIVGLGWTGSILAHELAEEGLEVVGIERGPWRGTPTDFSPASAPDELRYRIRHEMFLRPAQMSLTFRNNPDQTALPVRDWGAFMLGNGVGGGGLHWNAETWRFLPTDFVLRSHLTQRYGQGFMPEDMTIQDWGLTFAELEPHYDRFEYLCGTCGTAGNLNGVIQQGGNPFEGPRARPYRNPAQKQPFSHALFGKAATEMGYKPFPQPSVNLSRLYTNPLGVQLAPCTYCGFCEWFGCANYSKSSPQTTIMPALLRKPNFTARTECEVTRIRLDGSGKRATGVAFVDSSDTEWYQPADLVILCAFQLFNVQLLMLSGIGQRYDAATGEGQIGRNFSHQTVSTALGFFDKDKFNFNPFISSGAIGMCIDEFNGDNFDHGPHGFVGGGYMGQVQSNGRPIEFIDGLPPGTPTWGIKWKQAMRDNYLSTVYAGSGVHASCYTYRTNYLDLDPKPRKAPYDITQYQTSHLCGGAIMSATPKDGAVNKYLQRLGRAQSLRPGREFLPAERRLQPDRHGGRAGVLVGGRDPLPVPEEPGPLVDA